MPSELMVAFLIYHRSLWKYYPHRLDGLKKMKAKSFAFSSARWPATRASPTGSKAVQWECAGIDVKTLLKEEHI
jgi:hypothetical protein